MKVFKMFGALGTTNLKPLLWGLVILAILIIISLSVWALSGKDTAGAGWWDTLSFSTLSFWLFVGGLTGLFFSGKMPKEIQTYAKWSATASITLGALLFIFGEPILEQWRQKVREVTTVGNKGGRPMTAEQLAARKLAVEQQGQLAAVERAADAAAATAAAIATKRAREEAMRPAEQRACHGLFREQADCQEVVFLPHTFYERVVTEGRCIVANPHDQVQVVHQGGGRYHTTTSQPRLVAQFFTLPPGGRVGSFTCR